MNKKELIEEIKRTHEWEPPFYFNGTHKNTILHEIGKYKLIVEDQISGKSIIREII